MMIQPNSIFTFRIEPSSCHSGCFHTTWTVPENLAYFDGHFPTQPILPAVAILDASIEFLRSATKNPKLELKTTSSAKFSQPILPGSKIEIFAHDLKENNWDLEWRLVEVKTDSTSENKPNLNKNLDFALG